MATQETLSKQTAAFIAAIAQNLPELSSSEMQYCIEHPGTLKPRLANLCPSIGDIRRRCVIRLDGIEFIQLFPTWDFVIMRSKNYPNVGIAVSNHDRRCGKGLRLVFRSEEVHEKFEGPCGCCDFYSQLAPWHGKKSQEEAIRLIRTACSVNGINTLIFHCWNKTMQWGDGLKLVDPYKKSEMAMLDEARLIQAFGWAYIADSEGKDWPLVQELVHPHDQTFKE